MGRIDRLETRIIGRTAQRMVRRSIVTCLAACLAATLTSGTAAQATTSIRPFHLTQVAPGDFVRVGVCAEATQANQDAIANIGFIVGRDGVAVIDPGGSLTDGQRLRASIRRVTGRKIRYVIMTHSHPDHVFGAVAFLPDHPIFVGHWRLPAALAQRQAYDHQRLAQLLGAASTGDPVMPGLLVHDRLHLDLGGRVLDLEAFPAAHTSSDLTILDSTTHTLWAGDLLFVGRVPALDGNLKGWLRAISVLSALPASRAVPGHGPASVSWPAGARDETRYLRVLLHDVRAVIAAGEDIDAAVASAGQSERGKWALFNDYNGRNVTEAYRELQWE